MRHYLSGRDLYYHDLMALRREQQLEHILRPSHTYVCNPPAEPIKTNRVIVQEDAFMCGDGPSSRDWMLLLLMVAGGIGLTFIVCLLLFLILMAMGVITGGTA